MGGTRRIDHLRDLWESRGVVGMCDRWMGPPSFVSVTLANLGELESLSSLSEATPTSAICVNCKPRATTTNAIAAIACDVFVFAFGFDLALFFFFKVDVDGTIDANAESLPYCGLKLWEMKMG